MKESIKIISPIDGSIVAERPYSSPVEISKCLALANESKSIWKAKTIKERAFICHKAIDVLCSNKESIAKEITMQMGRPIRYAAAEIGGLEDRARYMIEIAEHELSDVRPDKKENHNRFIRREPLGVVMSIAPWNYPYLTAVNSIIPALMAGNCVILKHSAQTFICADRFKQAFEQAGMEEGVFQVLYLDHSQTTALISSQNLDYISFTGSVTAGEIIEKTVAGSFKGVALELGGKDPAYVRDDVVLEQAVESLLDGAFYNSGQSCCAVERIYVQKNIYDEFLKKFIDKAKNYVLGNPLNEKVSLGPMISSNAADFVRKQIKQACEMGATACIDETKFPLSKPGTCYMAPQVLINVNHKMSIMMEESFAPVVGVMEVENDEQAIHYMNDSPYGLSASVWTKDESAAIDIGKKLQTGTVFMNECDYLDPALAWVGVKNSGRGCSLSVLGYQQLTRPKSFNLKREL